LFFVVLDDPAGDVDQCHLGRLRGPCESLEGLYPGEVVSLHQEAFGLSRLDNSTEAEMRRLAQVRLSVS